MSHEKIVILDFGGQYAHLIASRIRRQNVLAEILEPEAASVALMSDVNIKGIILSGGPQSVFDADSPKCDPAIFNLGKPVLGICYGHQFLNNSLGGEVTPGKIKEYGRAELEVIAHCTLFEDIPEKSVFWMSHGDEVTQLPEGFEVCGRTDDCGHAAVWHESKNLYGIQFHPEVTHSEFGGQVLKNFLKICEVSGDWTIEKFFEEEKQKIMEAVGDKNVFLFVSGGVDSSVSFAFLSQILGADRVKGLFVDTGMLRQGEVDFVETSLKAIGADLTTLRSADQFLGNLKDVYDPEKKREIIGHTFLEVQQEFFSHHDLHDDWVLAQGTIYPDTIETGGTKHAAKIKTHHNRAPAVQKLIDEGKIIEPIKELYKDEVRALGEFLGLPHELVWRHPFPGPGLGVRILCNEADEKIDIAPQGLGEIQAFTMQEKKKPFVVLPIKSVGVQGDGRSYRHPGLLRMGNGEWGIGKMEKLATKLINHYRQINRCVVMLGQNFEGSVKQITAHKTCVSSDRVAILQRADHIVTETLIDQNLYSDVWQFPTVLLPLSFNDSGRETIVLRPIDSIDAMSASVGKLPESFFQEVAEKILEDTSISAVLLDVTSKPPGTIEWE